MTRRRVVMLWMQAPLAFAVSMLGAVSLQTEPSLETVQPTVPVVAAHHELLAEVIEQSGVTTSTPEPGIGPYIAYAASRVTEAIMGWLAPLGAYASDVGGALAWLARVMIAVALALLVLALVRYVRQRLRAASSTGVAPATDVCEPEHLRREHDRDAWRRELEDRLARSDVNGALEATWWWLARAVLGETVRSSWTSGELLFKSRRPALREPLRTLERLMYGGVSPSVDDVRALARRLEETLA